MREAIRKANANIYAANYQQLCQYLTNIERYIMRKDIDEVLKIMAIMLRDRIKAEQYNRAEEETRQIIPDVIQQLNDLKISYPI